MTILAAILALAAVTDTVSLTQVRDVYPVLSPDGTRLLFQSNRSGRWALWMADRDGGNPRLFFDGGSDGTEPVSPVWSPDGRRIAFAMRPAGGTGESESEIYTIDPDGRNLDRLTHEPGDDSHPHWSRSGRIYFNSPRATPDLSLPWERQWHDIYSVAADGSDVRRHTECRSLCTYPVPSPDERFVVHRRAIAGEGRDWEQGIIERNSEVFVTPLDGSASVNVSSSPAFDGWPTWSPDGRWIVFASNRDGVPSTGQIYAVRPDGSGLRPLTSGGLSRVQPSFDTAGTQLFVYESVENAVMEIGHVASFAVNFDD